MLHPQSLCGASRSCTPLRPADRFVPISLPAGPSVWVDLKKARGPVPVVQQFAQPSPEFSPWTK
ncbi:hypothetical protein CBM2604_A140165 [Cupriavidus taiwanensis]|nr:hypothetical protein CBM2604_A140165 [Cupriavidus taiwanensis]